MVMMMMIALPLRSKVMVVGGGGSVNWNPTFEGLVHPCGRSGTTCIAGCKIRPHTHKSHQIW